MPTKNHEEPAEIEEELPAVPTEVEPAPEAPTEEPTPEAEPELVTAFRFYDVKIIVPALNVRKEPGLASPVVQTLVNDKNVYVIADEAVIDDDTWGLLESGLGWISLKYTKKL